ncbi:IPExxxVDY family protein [Cryomorpha ignava]|uniref:IPExxxVDY family protein n=1 Tax=Cryomorpha ignava TaxID=101383 RepID=A0A7K3WUD0_9FLAO|nr:IPExxxVDY family protein [Cryomorpha ignava]NEN25279.1 IPExxxVDY family protein [Cryomorpha ignava]
MAKFTLRFDEEYPYYLIGINASAKDYRICWSINKALNIALKREDSIDVHSKNKDIVAHSYFVYTNEELNLKFRLIENKRGNSRFLTEVQQADYLLIIDESESVDMEGILKKIKEIRQVLLAFEIDIENLKNKQNLMLTA